MKKLDVFLSIAIWVCVFPFPVVVVAHDSTHKHADWFNNQEMTPASRERMQVPWKSCCDAGDHFQTRFRLVEDGSKYGTETYEYLKDGVWKIIPADIVQRKPTPDGSPVLFINKYTGVELCFFIDREGI